MGAVKDQVIEKDHANAAAIDVVEAAYKEKKIGPRQYRALGRHATKHTPEHMEKMLSLMTHKTLREAHKEALKTVGI